jgi:hypothetical protein
MAGAGAKLFVDGTILDAVGINTYLMDQAVMRFASTAARDAAFGGSGEPVLAEGMFAYTNDTNTLWFYTGSVWQAVLGSNIGTISTSNRNGVFNGNMAIWQRGTSVSTTGASASFGADRWQIYRNTTGATMSRQTTSDTTNLPQIQYCSRTQRTVSTTSTAPIYNSYSFETVDSIRFAGQPVTFSFYARAGANYSAASSGLSYILRSGTGTNQNNLDGFTGVTNIVSNTATLTTTWQRFEATGSVSSNATQLGILFTFTPVGTAGTNDWFEITGIQVESGSVATPFEFEDFGTTLEKCQRYYQKSWAYATAPLTGATVVGIQFGGASAATAQGSSFGQITFVKPFRANPTVTIYSYVGATAGVVSSATGTDLAANSGVAHFISEKSANVYNASGGTITPATGGFVWHFVASSEL